MLPDFGPYSRECRSHRRRRSFILINLVKYLEANRYTAPPEGYTRAELAAMLGCHLPSLAVLLSPRSAERVWLDGWLVEIGWEAVRRPMPAGGIKEWFVRES